MMNYIALHTVNALIKDSFRWWSIKQIKFMQLHHLRSEFLSNLQIFQRLHYGIFVALAMVVVMWFILRKNKNWF